MLVCLRRVVRAIAAVSLATGGGPFFAAGLSTALILVILVGVKPIEEAYRARIQSCTPDLERTSVALTRVSRRAIDAGAEKLKDAPGIHRIDVTKTKRG